ERQALRHHDWCRCGSFVRQLGLRVTGGHAGSEPGRSAAVARRVYRYRQRVGKSP
ncbi:MAG: hypothetical protein AVDCRST_MAG87-2385, partial [uncultured Thermomicrobiales bacterium]